MADNVVIYWVPYKGTLYAANMVTRTYVGISSEEKLGAVKRALDWAGVPHKDWGRGEPNGMEEFGTEAHSETDTANYVIETVKQILRAPEFSLGNGGRTEQAVGHSAEARRMLGVLLGWNAPGDGTPEIQGFSRLVERTPWQIVKQKSNGWWYAYAPGIFFHIRDMDHYFFLRTARLVPDEKWALVAEDNMTQFIHDEMAACGDQRIEDLGPVVAPPEVATYTVKAGDTLGAIAKATGKSVADLVAWNKLANPDAINEGQVLRLGP